MRSFTVNIVTETKRLIPGDKRIKDTANNCLRMEGIKGGGSLNILFCDDKRIKELNKRFLNKDAPTDVIAFGGGKKKAGLLGELAISVETAEYNAKRFNTSREYEIMLYIVHGILHLLGYRDAKKKEENRMRDRQDMILASISG
ncbi:MAG: rRNA maturation RNase YbeY [Candidatus Omnitrophica bacterium]|nr:rRNA maturation RNase YbeY [Candidatus Omnitrophota bacterium]